MIIPGQATSDGTKRYQHRHQRFAPDYFQETSGLIASSIGIGTCIGNPNQRTDILVTKALMVALRKGINVIDTSISYRLEQGERSVKEALENLTATSVVSRDEVIIGTKGGIVPPKSNQRDWFYRHYIEPGKFNLTMEDLVAKRYCLHPDYLRDQLDRSLMNLGLETIDIYYIHNPETQRLGVSAATLYQRLRKAFEVMEEAVEVGKIAAYGIATWHGLRVPPTSLQHLDLIRVKAIAKEVAGNRDDHFKFVQLPINLAMLEALVVPTQQLEGQLVPALTAIDRLGLSPIASRSIYASRVAGKIPSQIASTFDKTLQTDCLRALQYTRSAPGLLTALVGMKTLKYVEDNLTLATLPMLDSQRFQELTYSHLDWWETIQGGRWKSLTRKLAKLFGRKKITSWQT